MNGRYICEKCLTRYQDGAECPSCEGEPLLDLQDPAVVEYLVALDEDDRRKTTVKSTAIATVVCLPLLVAGLYFMPAHLVGRDGKMRYEIPFGAYVLCVLALDGTLLATFPPRRRVPPEGFWP